MHQTRSSPEGYLLTWSGYGTRLPGGVRGSVDDLHNTFGQDLAPPDPRRESLAKAAMRWPAFRIGSPHRAIIEATIVEHCRIKKWDLVRLNVRTDHVHAVITRCGADPDVAMEQFKAWCTRRLREAGLVGPDRQVWTRRGSTRYLWTPDDVVMAADYVERFQGADLPGHRKDGVVEP